jgi:sporulation protein YlmC with PRC-barrel domain
MKASFFDLAGQVLDHPVIDVNNYPCGKVDDIILEQGANNTFRVKSILVGPGAWARRLSWLFGSVAAKLFGDEVVEIPWEQVEQITPKVKLRLPADTLGLGKADKRATKIMIRLLGS